jgi:predicted O-methyltransferase YrrM
MQAVVFDLPATQPFAEETIARFGLADRITFTPGDYLETPLPGGFDVVWMSHILHAERPDDCRRLIDRAAGALAPGGLMVIHDFFLNAAMDGPLFPSLFALNMLLGTDGGQAYSFEQVQAMLTAAGLRHIERLPLETPNDSGLLMATA